MYVHMYVLYVYTPTLLLVPIQSLTLSLHNDVYTCSLYIIIADTRVHSCANMVKNSVWQVDLEKEYYFGTNGECTYVCRSGTECEPQKTLPLILNRQ